MVWQGLHNLLHPVADLHCYLYATSSVSVDALLVDPISLVHYSKACLSQLVCSVLKSSQPAARLLLGHDVYKYAALAAIVSNMSWADIQALGFWHSSKSAGSSVFG